MARALYEQVWFGSELGYNLGRIVEDKYCQQMTSLSEKKGRIEVKTMESCALISEAIPV